MASGPSLSTCCLKNFQWTGTPTGKESKLASNNAYITGANPHAALLYIHDALGWNFTNARLLADHFATEADLTVFLPDFFGGEELDKQAILEARWSDLDMDGFRKRNARAVREPEILAAARALRDLGFAKVGVVGYCFGGWAALVLASARPLLQTPLVDAVICAHPSWTTHADYEGIAAPILILAPEKDYQFTDELKRYAFEQLVLKNRNVPAQYLHLPGVAHGCLTKGDEKVLGEREAMVQAKDAAVAWCRQWLS